MNVWVICQSYAVDAAASKRINGLARPWQADGISVTVMSAAGLAGLRVEEPTVAAPDTTDLPVTYYGMRAATVPGQGRPLMHQLAFAGHMLVRRMFPAKPKTPAGTPDVVVACAGGAGVLPAAWLLARRHRAKLVVDVVEVASAGTAAPQGERRVEAVRQFGASVVRRLDQLMYRQADAVVTATRSLARDIHAQGVPADQLQVVFSGVSDDDLRVAQQARQDNSVARLRAQLGISPLSAVVLCLDAHDSRQALGQLIDAARLMVRRTDVIFLLVGQGPDKDRLISYAKGVPNVQFLPPVAAADAWTYRALADVNIVCQQNDPSLEQRVPDTLFDVMAAQACAVGGLRGEAGDIMQESGCALVVPSEEPEKMASAIVTLLDEADRRRAMGAAGRAYVEKNFRYSLLAAGYARLLRRVCGRPEAAADGV